MMRVAIFIGGLRPILSDHADVSSSIMVPLERLFQVGDQSRASRSRRSRSVSGCRAARISGSMSAWVWSQG
jgi:hypothetical protein